ncbi:hypothetical protein SZN_21451 [Streptomyces zinciresistens K42]|uniref:Uncharacterized protein n=1 Tax=Streptomyces zinciresistens K42 TaxID=700597 RepID=G2GFK6_9ACTN|nr:hypothetical protein [Streptomyces zinciresistens]EGX57701.1 hypothetical protein SZN_21451 [Streptomyces zinciresistens K42]
MTTIFGELVEKQRAAEHAHGRVEELRGKYGPPTQVGGWGARQTETYNTALRAWRDLARDLQVAVAAYARERGASRSDVEDQLKKAARHADAGGRGV